MMGQRVFIIIALMASLCVAVPTTDLVVPEAKHAGTTGAKFVQSTLKSGGTENADFLETHDAATNLLSLHAPAMLDELATLSKEAHTSGQTTAIKQLKHVMVLLEATPNGTATDGGTKKLADRSKTMRDVVQSAIVAMQSGLDSDFTAALADLSTLLNVINSTVRTVETSEQTSIKLKAHNWCIAKEAEDNSTKICRDATTNVTNFDPAIAVNDAFYKHIGSITDCPAGTALVDGKCPAGVVYLDESTLKAGFQDARDAYHELDVTKTTECGIKTVDETNVGTNQTAYETTIATILDDHVAACNPDSTVYTTAVTSFNTNNGHRAAMYKSLDKIKCYVNNIQRPEHAAACISALSTDYATKYTDHTTAAPTCPTRAVYALQISNYESLSLTESWEPSDANTCADLAATPTTPTPVYVYPTHNANGDPLTPITDSNFKAACKMYNGDTAQCLLKYGDISDWDTSKVTDMSNPGLWGDGRRGTHEWDADLSKWDTSSVTTMNNLFVYAFGFTGKGLETWDVSKVRDMGNMFTLTKFPLPQIGGWDVSNVESMYDMFGHNTNFNADIRGWDVRNVNLVGNMFYQCTSFTHDLSGWDMASLNHPRLRIGWTDTGPAMFHSSGIPSSKWPLSLQGGA